MHYVKIKRPKYNYSMSDKELIEVAKKYDSKCPKCNAVLKVRKAKKTGNVFISCSTFPRCKWVCYKA